jgi:hypothetical protein
LWQRIAVWLLAFDELLKHRPKNFHQCLRLGLGQGREANSLSHDLEAAMAACIWVTGNRRENDELLGFGPIRPAADNLVGFAQMAQRLAVFSILKSLAACGIPSGLESS